MLVLMHACIEYCTYFHYLKKHKAIFLDFSSSYRTLHRSYFNTVLLEYMYLHWEVSYHFKCFMWLAIFLKLFSLHLLSRNIPKRYIYEYIYTILLTIHWPFWIKLEPWFSLYLWIVYFIQSSSSCECPLRWF